MKDEIKEILDDLLFTTTLPNASVKLNKEKLNIITKMEELVFWLEQYRSLYLEDNNE